MTRESNIWEELEGDARRERRRRPNGTYLNYPRCHVCNGVTERDRRVGFVYCQTHGVIGINEVDLTRQALDIPRLMKQG